MSNIPPKNPNFFQRHDLAINITLLSLGSASLVATVAIVAAVSILVPPAALIALGVGGAAIAVELGVVVGSTAGLVSSVSKRIFQSGAEAPVVDQGEAAVEESDEEADVEPDLRPPYVTPPPSRASSPPPDVTPPPSRASSPPPAPASGRQSPQVASDDEDDDDDGFGSPLGSDGEESGAGRPPDVAVVNRGPPRAPSLCGNVPKPQPAQMSPTTSGDGTSPSPPLILEGAFNDVIRDMQPNQLLRKENDVWKLVEAVDAREGDMDYQTVILRAEKGKRPVAAMLLSFVQVEASGDVEPSVALRRATIGQTLVSNLVNVNTDAVPLKAAKYQKLLENLQAKFPQIPDFQGRENQVVLAELAKIEATFARIPREVRSTEDLDTLRSLYCQEAIPALRAANRYIESGANIDIELKKIVWKLSYDVIVGADLREASKNLVDGIVSASKVPMLEGDATYTEKLEQKHKAMREVPHAYTVPFFHLVWRSLKDNFDYKFNSITAGNPNERKNMWNIRDGGGAKQVEVLAFGSPTNQDGTAEINPEFKGYLRHLKEIGQKHLYFSFQNCLNKESRRNNLILGLQEQEDFKDVFCAVAFTMNSHLYKGYETITKDDFARQFATQYGGDREVTGCYIPGDKFEFDIRGMVADLTNSLFPDANDLSKVQQNFVYDLATVFVQASMIKQYGPDKMNYTCKDGIDRGMSAKAKNEYLLAVLAGTEETPEFKKIFEDTLFPRAQWTRHRAIIHEHFERVMHYMDAVKASREVIGACFGRFLPGVTQFEVANLTV